MDKDAPQYVEAQIFEQKKKVNKDNKVWSSNEFLLVNKYGFETCTLTWLFLIKNG